MNRKQELEQNSLFKLLIEENIAAFNAQKSAGKDSLDFSGAMLRGLDLREIDAKGINFKDAYLRGADLRGVDLRETELEGASMADAKISGTYFPNTLCAEEIRLSVEKGTRLRTTQPAPNTKP